MERARIEFNDQEYPLRFDVLNASLPKPFLRIMRASALALRSCVATFPRRATEARFRTIVCSALCAVIMGIAGCTRAAPTPAKPVPSATPEAGESGPAVRLQKIDKSGYPVVIAHLPGKVVLVDFWATWCTYCRENFPHTVEMSRKYGPQGLVVISLACDDEAEAGEALEFLKSQNATFQNLRAAQGADEQTFEDFEITGGALPHLKLYDRTGKLRKTFASDPEAEKQFTMEEVEAAVVELLTEKPAEPQPTAGKVNPAEEAKRADGEQPEK